MTKHKKTILLIAITLVVGYLLGWIFGTDGFPTKGLEGKMDAVSPTIEECEILKSDTLSTERIISYLDILTAHTYEFRTNSPKQEIKNLSDTTLSNISAAQTAVNKAISGEETDFRPLIYKAIDSYINLYNAANN